VTLPVSCRSAISPKAYVFQTPPVSVEPLNANSASPLRRCVRPRTRDGARRRSVKTLTRYRAECFRIASDASSDRQSAHVLDRGRCGLQVPPLLRGSLVQAQPPICGNPTSYRQRTRPQRSRQQRRQCLRPQRSRQQRRHDTSVKSLRCAVAIPAGGGMIGAAWTDPDDVVANIKPATAIAARYPVLMAAVSIRLQRAPA
jgi:hypothetical protein